MLGITRPRCLEAGEASDPPLQPRHESQDRAGSKMRDFTTQFFVILVSGAVLLMATPQPALADDIGAGGEDEAAAAALAGVVRELPDEVRKLRDELAEIKSSETPAVSAAADGMLFRPRTTA